MSDRSRPLASRGAAAAIVALCAALAACHTTPPAPDLPRGDVATFDDGVRLVGLESEGGLPEDVTVEDVPPLQLTLEGIDESQLALRAGSAAFRIQPSTMPGVVGHVLPLTDRPRAHELLLAVSWNGRELVIEESIYDEDANTLTVLTDHHSILSWVFIYIAVSAGSFTAGAFIGAMNHLYIRQDVDLEEAIEAVTGIDVELSVDNRDELVSSGDARGPTDVQRDVPVELRKPATPRFTLPVWRGDAYMSLFEETRLEWTAIPGDDVEYVLYVERMNEPRAVVVDFERVRTNSYTVRLNEWDDYFAAVEAVVDGVHSDVGIRTFLVCVPDPCECGDNGCGQPCARSCSDGSACINNRCESLAPDCGDGWCEPTESCSSCREDCGPCTGYCGDGDCESTETCISCPEDCGTCGGECGNGDCELDETCATCARDCGPCGDCSTPSPPTCAADMCTDYGSTCCTGCVGSDPYFRMTLTCVQSADYDGTPLDYGLCGVACDTDSDCDVYEEWLQLPVSCREVNSVGGVCQG